MHFVITLVCNVNFFFYLMVFFFVLFLILERESFFFFQKKSVAPVGQPEGALVVETNPLGGAGICGAHKEAGHRENP
jgi:hypothetical protein